jgi:hypothetical protein
MRLEVLTVPTRKIIVFWEMTLPALVLPLPTSVPLLPSSVHPFTTKMEAARSSKTLIMSLPSMMEL